MEIVLDPWPVSADTKKSGVRIVTGRKKMNSKSLYQTIYTFSESEQETASLDMKLTTKSLGPDQQHTSFLCMGICSLSKKMQQGIK